MSTVIARQTISGSLSFGPIPVPDGVKRFVATFARNTAADRSVLASTDCRAEVEYEMDASDEKWVKAGGHGIIGGEYKDKLQRVRGATVYTSHPEISGSRNRRLRGTITMRGVPGLVQLDVTFI